VTVYSGKFVDGKVVVEGDPPPDGTEVEVHVVESDGEVWLTPDMEADLEAAIERLDRGEGVTWEEVRENLRRIEQGGRDAPARP
jgi:hypothetical protein